MIKRREEEEDIHLNFYVVQSPSSASSSICRDHHHHHHHLKQLTPKQLPINIDHDDDDDEEEEGGVASSSMSSTCRNNTITSMEMLGGSCSSPASLTTCIYLDKNIQVIPLLVPPTLNDEGSILSFHDDDANNNNNKKNTKFGKYPFEYHKNHPQINMKEDEDDDDDKGGCCKYLSMKTYPKSSLWIALQLLWRMLISLLAALLVFYIVTKPPPPHLSLQVGGVKELELGEGVDRSGVETKLLTCNISMLLMIDNKSNLFSLHLHSLTTSLYYRSIPLVAPRQQLLEEEEEVNKKEKIMISVGVRGMPMYGAGREMEDAAHLELVSTLWLHSYYNIIPLLIRPNFHHKASCLISLPLFYPITQPFNTTCRYFLS